MNQERSRRPAPKGIIPFTSGRREGLELLGQPLSGDVQPPLDGAHRIDTPAHHLADLVVDRLGRATRHTTRLAAGRRGDAARSVGADARDAGRAAAVVLGAVARALLAAGHLRVGIEALLGAVDLGPVELGVHARHHASRAHGACEDRLDAFRELLLEAGFRKTEVYWEGTDHSSGEGNGIFRQCERAAEDPAWVAYIAAIR